MRTIVMTVKARHIRNMRLGIKKQELRKTRPGKQTPLLVVLCQSGSGGAVVASFTCRAIPDLTEADDMKIAEMCAITAAEVRGYRAGGKGRLYGWPIKNFEDWREKGLHVTDFGLDRPPQSWCYAKVVEKY